jgi:hypothetical protein
MATTTMATSTNTTTQSQQQPVMSLLEKYSNLYRCIDQAREDTAKHQQHIQDTQRQMQGLLEDRNHMQAQEHKAEDERQQLIDEVDQALQDVMGVEQEYTVARANHVKTKSTLEAVTRQSKDYRQHYLQASKAFRSSYKRLCVRGQQQRSSSLGSWNHPAQALGAYAVAVKRRDLQQVFQQQDDNDSSAGVDRDAVDDELAAVQVLVKAQEQATLQRKRNREVLQAKNKTLLEKASKRKYQRQQLQAQLDRIQQDVRDVLESQIQDLQQQTEECKTMATNFQNGKMRNEKGVAGTACG